MRLTNYTFAVLLRQFDAANSHTALVLLQNYLKFALVLLHVFTNFGFVL